MDLFNPLSRSERQEIGRQNWIKHKCCGTCVWPTGVGKTRLAINCIKSVLKKYPKFKVLVVVPTEVLQNQWVEELDALGLGLNCDVQIINTVIKNKWKVDILIIDE